MTVDTHCLPAGALGSYELPVPNFPGGATVNVPSGSKRGLVVMMHGLNTAPGCTAPYPSPIGDSGGDLPILFQTLSNDLVADGWLTVQPPYTEESVSNTSPCIALQNDISNDAGKGARYLNQMLHWWDHVVLWMKANYGNWPIVPFGMSWGGWHALQIAIHRTSTVAAYCAHHAPVILSDTNPAWTTPANYTALDTSGLDVGVNGLNAVDIPGLIGWGTLDPAPDNPTNAPDTYDTNSPTMYTNANNAGMPVTSNSQVESHILYTNDVTAITTWFTNTVDPLCPKVH